MLRKLVLAVSFSTLAAFSGSVLAAAFDVTDIEGRKVHFEDQPKTFVVANYIANFMMVGGAPVTQSFADSIGADAYAVDAASAAEIALTFFK